MSDRKRPARSSGQIFAAPLALGVASVAGLVLGLTGDGLPDMAAWALLGAVPLTILGAWLRRENRVSTQSLTKDPP